MLLSKPTLTALAALFFCTNGTAQEFDQIIPMRDKGAATYYVDGEISGFGATEFMVDTGSGYMTINEDTLSVLLQEEQAEYVKDLAGVLANGSRMVVPVYRLSAVNIGGECWLKDVDAAVFPGKTRQILGLSALKMAAPFIFSVEPPRLTLSHCSRDTTRIGQAETGNSPAS